MLSPGKYHLSVPRDIESNLKYRRWLAAEAWTDAALCRALVEACRLDVLFYINSFTWAYDPRRIARPVVPFITRDYQEEALFRRPGGLLYAVEHGRDVAIEKSRDMGATWLCLLLQSWLALFHQYQQVLNINRNEDAVDGPSPNSLFQKLKWTYDHTPGWLTGGYRKLDMFFGFPRTSSVISGEATTKKAGVGGRAGLIFLDEFPELEAMGQTVRERTANTADCRVFNGTHKGVGTPFDNLCQTPEVDKIVMHWTQHPEKWRGLYRADPERPGQVEVLDKAYPFPPDYAFVLDGTPTGGPKPGLRSPWYDAMCKKIGDARAIAMDLDIDPAGSASQVFDPLVVRDYRLSVCRPPTWEGLIEAGELIERPGGLLKLWCPVEGGRPVVARGHTFGAGADVSRGRGTTNSCLSVGCVQTGEKVCEYADPSIKPEDFAALTFDLLGLFGDVLLAWETPGPGLDYGDDLIALGFTNYYTKTDEHDPVKKYKRSTAPGWVNQPKSMDSLVTQYGVALKDRKLLNRSDIAVGECLAYKFGADGHIAHGTADSKTVDPSGAKVNHGDRVVADGLMWLMMTKRGTLTPARPQEQEPADDYGSLAWRRRRHEDRLRLAESWAG